MRDNIVFKGSRNGLQLIINESAEFEEIIGQLKAKLKAATDFFTVGTIIQVPVADGLLTAEQRTELQQVFSDYSLIWQEKVPEARKQAETEMVELPTKQEDYNNQTLIVARTIRGGQEIIHRGTVVVLGDVNPGAEVIAGGDIIIHGACRGIAHAGAYGDTDATITANQLLASQIRIAGLIARAPDNQDKPAYVETARIRDGIVLIEPANK